MDVDVLIWRGDGIPHTNTTYASRAAQKLTQVGLKCTEVSYLEGERPPQNWREIPCHFLTGGNTSVAADLPELHQAHEHVGELVSLARGGTNLLVGVCQGSQMLASALAGTECVKPSPNGLEVGLAEIDFVGHSEPICEARRFLAPQFHYHEIDQQFLGSSGAELLCSNHHSEVQGYQVDERILGYQFHPELDGEDTRLLLEDNAALIQGFRQEPSELQSRVDALGSALSPMLFQRAVATPMKRFLNRTPSLLSEADSDVALMAS